MGTVTVQDSAGRAYDVDERDVPGLESQGFRRQTFAERAQPAIEAATEVGVTAPIVASPADVLLVVTAVDTAAAERAIGEMARVGNGLQERTDHIARVADVVNLRLETSSAAIRARMDACPSR